MEEDQELSAIRAKRIQELQNESSSEAQKNDLERKRQLEETRQHILSQVTTANARERLSRIALVKPDKARAVEDMIIRAGQSGSLTQKVDEAKLIQLLEQLSEQKKETKITIQRRRYNDDDE
jgi:programmed cell death protein 5